MLIQLFFSKKHLLTLGATKFGNLFIMLIVIVNIQGITSGEVFLAGFTIVICLFKVLALNVLL